MTLLERCVGRPASELAAYPPDQLLDLKKQANDALARAKANVELVDRALDLRYSRVAAVHRVAAGKDAGTVSFNDGVVRISCELPKKVEWDQGKLRRIVERIRAAGDDPTEFVEISYRVSETKYNSWPTPMRASFDPARTLKTGKPAFRLSMTEGGA
ncbi:hypothetical protein J5226_03695 [Lysobacter sp. K5869]|uniref:hypothetical protein n=1 Tax=Lysobacter sp. K5869 TaxID=2820808 RepID=UPI001C06175E|nr:hypothetical protein [Lysobacter sp. K5869]QWP77520.1 hypothetical protein J5226_03695 [Lysobacter sp. K5869]